MDPEDVIPNKWNDIKIIFNDDVEEGYSAIWGRYHHVLNDGTSSDKWCLGTRWNGDEDAVGYPNQGRNPLWFCEPEYLTLPILQRLLALSLERPHLNKYTNDIMDVMRVVIVQSGI